MLPFFVAHATSPQKQDSAPIPRDTLAHAIQALRSIGYAYVPEKRDSTQGTLTHAGITLPSHLGFSSVSGGAWPSDALYAIYLDLTLHIDRPAPRFREVIEDAPEGLDGRFMLIPVSERKTLIGGWADVGHGSTYASTRGSLDWLWKDTVHFARAYGYLLASGKKRRAESPNGSSAPGIKRP